MVLITSIFLLIILIWNICFKRNYTSPVIFWSAIWFISSTFVWLNPFGMIEVEDKATIIIFLGIFSYILGAIRYSNRRLRIVNFNSKAFWRGDEFNKTVCYILVAVTLVFNAMLTVAAINMLRGGTSYSDIRDILFGYGDAETSYFSSSFMSTFYSWIIVPSVSVLLVVLLVNLFKRALPSVFNWIVLADIVMYIFASSGRLLLMHAVILLAFLAKYYGVEISKKNKRRLRIGIVLGLAFLLIITFYRTKDSSSVSSIYSYFSIDYPLFSYWMNYVDKSGHFYYGSAFLRGILEGLNFFLGKVNLSTPGYWEMQEIFNLIQNRWIEVFPGNWYNAYATCFFYFYLDFGVIGVVLGSFIFGRLSRYVYDKLLQEKSLSSLLIYMLMIEYIVDSFIRWRLGTFSSLVALFLAYLCVKRKKLSVRGK